MHCFRLKEIIHGHVTSCIAGDVHDIGHWGFIVHLRGKLRRFFLVHMRPGFVRRQQALRKGECLQCGVCCALLFSCPMLTREGMCRIYRSGRWQVCKVFPIDERDIQEVALMGGSCGYHFEGTPSDG